MRVVTQVSDLRSILNAWRRADDEVSFVPTMGNIHEGHLSLIEEARKRSDRIVSSIFVNPMQFDRPTDYGRYPRTFEEDKRQLQDAGVDLLFNPPAEVIYPRGFENSTYVDVPGITDILCGAHRPGHFRGVATIVCKLFNLVQPKLAVFGEK
ncbi:MAG TPA: pantoate--beta-alanine ligase, partial [Gammaproteobacteria bacterium]|nr:pantoate--beta-alanine ligase [Gammaproteobacteria bacterium]